MKIKADIEVRKALAGDRYRVLGDVICPHCLNAYQMVEYVASIPQPNKTEYCVSCPICQSYYNIIVRGVSQNV